MVDGDVSTGLECNLVVRRSENFMLDVEMSIEPGETAALVGPNGAGKSTVVDALAGIAAIDRGRIELNGLVLDDPEAGLFVPTEERGVGVVFQRYLLFEHLDVLDNVAFGPSVTGANRADARASARIWIERFDLDDIVHSRPSEISGGQAQRVALARTLAAEPTLLLLDEPLAALDVETKGRLRTALRAHLDGFDGPRLLITHEPADAFLLSDRILIIEGGSITQTGTRDDIRRRPATPYVAAFAGLNLLSGRNVGGSLELDDHGIELRSADTRTEGSVLITIHPNAIALHAEQPHGSPRNSWRSAVAELEPLGDITRVTLDQPLPLSVDVTPAAAAALDLAPGTPIWTSIKATEIELNPR